MRHEIHTYRYNCDGRGCPAHHVAKAKHPVEADNDAARMGWRQNGWNWFCPAHTITGARVDVQS